MPNIRKQSAAGSMGFYPGNAVELTKMVAGFFAEVEKEPLGGRPVALIAPHAGYQYSGKTAARAFKLLEGESFDTVVVVCPSHTIFFKGASVYQGDGYQTPLGVVETDKELSKKIASINPRVYFSQNGHTTGTTRGEHALEVMLPFLQVVLGKFKLVAIVMGDQEQDTVNALGEVLGSALQESNALLLASTDLSHFYNEKKARRLDGEVQKAIEKFDPSHLIDVLSYGKGEACGGGPVASVLTAAKRLGGTKVRSLDYTTSGAVTGDFDEVVGYLSAVVIDTGSKKKKKSITMGERPARVVKYEGLTDEDKEALQEVARKAIKARLEDKHYTPPETETLSVRKGAFVTLKIDGNVRGYMGRVRANQAVSINVAEMAAAAAFDDPNFPPVSAEELEKLEIEISVLSSKLRVESVRDIQVGRDGLMIKLDMHTGLLLPQAAAEAGWDAEEFMGQVCLKAGLPRGSHRDRFAEVFKFTAEVF